MAYSVAVRLIARRHGLVGKVCEVKAEAVYDDAFMAHVLPIIGWGEVAASLQARIPPGLLR